MIGGEMRRAILILTVASTLLALPASAAFAAPDDHQQFEARVLGKAGTDKKPASVGSYLHPYATVNSSGGPANDGGVNSGQLLEPTFETVLAHVYLPKQMKLATKGFPTCTQPVILAAPDTCPAGSEIGQGVAAGYARNSNAAPGTYLLAPALTVRVFIITAKSIGLRVISPVTAASIITGDIGPAKGALAKTYGTDIFFKVPKGLTEPLPGVASQLSSFDSAIAARKNSRGLPLQSLKACPKSKKLDFGYAGLFNIGLDKTRSPKTALGYSINSVGRVVNVKVPCR